MTPVGIKCPIKIGQPVDAACRVDQPECADMHIVHLHRGRKRSLGRILSTDWASCSLDVHVPSAGQLR